jgi:multidrug efflux pump subunit AcrA (membrane-fusion protein)
LGKDVKFMGKIINIDPASTEIQGVVYYKVKVSLIDNNDIRVKSGMTANVVVNTDSRTNILYLPSRAVLSKDGDQKYVRVLINNQIIEKDVVLGMKGDNGIVEIVSGVNQGDEIVLKSLK